MFTYLPHPKITPSDDRIEFISYLLQAENLESFIFRALHKRHTVLLGSFDSEMRDSLSIVVKPDKLSSTKSELIELYFAAVRSKIKSAHAWKPITEFLLPHYQAHRVRVGERRMDARYEQLRIKTDPWEGEVIAPANSMVPIVLSYATLPRGTVEITARPGELQSAAFVMLAEMTCTYIPPVSRDQVLREVVSIRMDHLARKLKHTRVGTLHFSDLPNQPVMIDGRPYEAPSAIN